MDKKEVRHTAHAVNHNNQHTTHHGQQQKIKKQEKRKERRRKIVFFVMALLIIHVTLTLSTCTVSYEVQPNNSIDDITGSNMTVATRDTLCFEKEYNYDYAWEGWEPEANNFISPRFHLYNYEAKTGTFVMYFAFFDNAKYPYSQFDGKLYETVEDRLPWDAAEMYSERIEVKLGPNDDRVITIFTEKKDPNVVYWVYPDVTVPTYVDCSSLQQAYKERQNITQTLKEKNNPVIETKTVTAWEWLIDKIIR